MILKGYEGIHAFFCMLQSSILDFHLLDDIY